MTYNIAAVERDTGLSKDVLRVWERRYGFPAPQRDAHGERLYSADEVHRLRLIKRLMDQGHRPGRLIATPVEELAALTPRHRPLPAGLRESSGDFQDLDALLDLIRTHDASRFQQAMQQRLARQGLMVFVQDTIAPLTRKIGEAWERGTVEVFEEHLYTELIQRLLRQAIASLPNASGGPRILLATLPEERHSLGLLMVEAVFAIEGAECISLGTQLPLLDLARAAEVHRVEIVALSFSIAFPARQIPLLLRQLRSALSESIRLWAGGAVVARLAPETGIEYLPTLDEARRALIAVPPVPTFPV